MTTWILGRGQQTPAYCLLPAPKRAAAASCPPRPLARPPAPRRSILTPGSAPYFLGGGEKERQVEGTADSQDLRTATLGAD